MSEGLSWYQQINDSSVLMQGDLIYGCPYIVPPIELSPETKVSVDIIEYDVIILTQSCDFNKKINLVLVAPFWPLKEIEEIYPQMKDDNLKESAKRGYQPSWLILDKLGDDFLVVDFKSAYSTSLATLKNIVAKNPNRWRLNPPYREHLSQEFAKFFMRVGLPKEIPHFSKFTINYCTECHIDHAVRQ